ncbi:Oidioi.mRNA.OKI2018_I69.PAR.g12390.t1.cds [Oikopleura dioica]|uniref:Oidioi.mRNA.OKI2018_I69.PAR.g12390.t1.cds n=1 Tax=Oikopleura dioica TaxID=34765 RepID=A0ABN7S7F6_OIKDI|nr:Oidioi.mRNA.OKI2018_I69.PAR.g12390.t1.cds [Oikopleura dioica]
MRCKFLLLALLGLVCGQFGSSSSSLLLRSLVESLERNLVAKIEHVERVLRDDLEILDDKISTFEDELHDLKKTQSELETHVESNSAKLDGVEGKIQAAGNQLADQFMDNINIVGMSVTQLSDRTQITEDLIKDSRSRIDDLEQASSSIRSRTERLEASAEQLELRPEDITKILTAVEEHMGGATAFELESRIGDLELRWDGNVDEKIENVTVIFDKRLEEMATETIGTIQEDLTKISTKTDTLQTSVETSVADLSVRVETAVAQSGALGDALAGTFQQYASLSSQIYQLSSDVDLKVATVQDQFTDLNQTIELLGSTMESILEEGAATAEFYEIKAKVLEQELSSSAFELRINTKLDEFAQRSDSVQQEISNMQTYQEEAGSRQQRLWDESANFTKTFKDFIVETNEHITDLTSRSAMSSEKLTQAYNMAESAKNGIKNAIRKADAADNSKEVSSLRSSLSNLEKSSNLTTVGPIVAENTEAAKDIRRMKIDIDTLRRNLQFQAARISGGDLGARVGGESTGASSEEIENLKAHIDSIDGQIDSIQDDIDRVESKSDATSSALKEFQIRSAAATSSLENTIEAQGNKCFAGLNEQGQILNTVRLSVKEISDDLFEEQTSASKKFESVEEKISNFDSKVDEFGRTQQSLSSSVSNFRQDVEISIAGYLTSFTQYIEKRQRGTHTTLRYVASNKDVYSSLEDASRILPFNDVVTDSNGSANGSGISIPSDGQYVISATVTTVKGSVIFVQVLNTSGEVRETVRLYEGSWSAAGNSIVMDLVRGDTVMIALSENGKVVDGIYNYFTVSLAEPA